MKIKEKNFDGWKGKEKDEICRKIKTIILYISLQKKLIIINFKILFSKLVIKGGNLLGEERINSTRGNG